MIRSKTGAYRVSPEVKEFLRGHVEDFATVFLQELAVAWNESVEARRIQGKKQHAHRPDLTQRHAEKALKRVLERLNSHPALTPPWLTAP
ncbi:MAG: hypothetical protein LC620_08770 [Halobacteriales archaeon]|nr:hypothetical protein [Halobacteriales archaeon]